jgi:hypothetical protein
MVAAEQLPSEMLRLLPDRSALNRPRWQTRTRLSVMRHVVSIRKLFANLGG